MDFSLPHPPTISVNSYIPKDAYLGVPRKMHLPLAQYLIQLIKKEGRGSYLYCCDVSRAYR